MRKPSRSPARSTSGLVLRTLRASAISETGMIAAAPFARAVTMELVARSTSNTTQTVWLRSRSLRATNSAGLKRTSRVFIFGKEGFLYACNGTGIVGQNRNWDQNESLRIDGPVEVKAAGVGSKVDGGLSSPKHRLERRWESHRRRAKHNRQFF